MVYAVANGYIETISESVVGQNKTKLVSVLLKMPWTSRSGQQGEDHLMVEFLGSFSDNIIGNYPEGSYVRVELGLYDTEYNGKWYHRVQGRSIGREAQAPQPQQPIVQQPVASQPVQQVQPVQQTSYDLPF